MAPSFPAQQQTIRLIKALQELGYSTLRAYQMRAPSDPSIHEVRLYTNGRYVHCLLLFDNGMSALYLQAGDPTLRGVETQIAALRTLHDTE